jgi:hypothetical protein
MKMKKKSKLVLGVCLAIGLAIAFISCGSSPVINEFMDPNLPVNGHAALSVSSNIIISSVDGQFSLSGKYGGNDWGREPVLVLAPGSHVFVLMYYDSGANSKTDGLSVTHKFEAGRYYRLFPERRDGKVAFMFEDRTIPGIWDTKPLSTVQPPKQKTNKSASVLPVLPRPGNITSDEYTKVILETAKDSVPTQIEGTWKWEQGNVEIVQTFAGNFFILKVRNSANPASNYINYGTFELSGNNISTNYVAEDSAKGLVYYTKSFNRKGKWSLTNADTLVIQEGVTKTTYVKQAGGNAE